MALQKTVLPILRSNRSCAPDFEQVLKENRWEGLARDEVKTLQINVGKFCNQACHHRHVEAGPKRTEIMPHEVAQRVLRVLAASASITSIDITGGAPELNPNFHWIVSEARKLGLHIIDRCNLTVLLEPAQERLAELPPPNQVDNTPTLPS